MASTSAGAATSSTATDQELHEALKHVLGIVEMDQERNYVTNALLFDQLFTAFASQLSITLYPTHVASDYAGVRLGQLYEDGDFALLLKGFRNNLTLDAFYAYKIINDAQRVLADMPNVRECTLAADADSVIIAGDLHGNFQDLEHLCVKYGQPGRNHFFVFNGDYVDRGAKQVETLLTLLYAFVQRPERVFLNRGNHEDISMNTSSHFNPNFMQDVRKKYGKFSSAIFTAATQMFRYLPVATIVKNKAGVRAFVVHGGVSDKTDLNHVRAKLERHKFEKLAQFKESSATSSGEVFDRTQLADLLWSDPIRYEDGKLRPKSAKKSTGCYFNSTRKLGTLFGSDITERFLKANDFNFLIRSHEVRDRGVSEDHKGCYTVFSASYYCDGDNMGAVFKLGANAKSLETYQYKCIGGDLSSVIVRKNHALIRQFKRLLQKSRDELMAEFEKHDAQRTGHISIDMWAQVLSAHFGGEISVANLVALKDMLCECENETRLVHYGSLFKHRNKAREATVAEASSPEVQNYFESVQNLFEILDQDHDNRISVKEAEDALTLINKKLGVKYAAQDQCVNFIKQMDLNGDNEIDIDEFKRAFNAEFFDEEPDKTSTTNKEDKKKKEEEEKEAYEDATDDDHHSVKSDEIEIIRV